MSHFVTVHLDPEQEHYTSTQHKTPKAAMEFANKHGCTYIHEVGGDWSEYIKCSFCGDWFDISEVDEEDLCEECRKAIEENKRTQESNDYRIVVTGTYDVQRNSITILDGWAEREWHTIKSFQTYKEAADYIKTLRA